MKKRYSVLLTTCLFILLHGCKEKGNGVLPTVTSLTESVYSSVTIEPDSFYQVYAATGGIINEIMVREGDSIRKGEPLMRIIDDNSKLLSNSAELEMNLAKQNYTGQLNVIQDLKNELAVAQLTLTNDSNNFKRQERLWDQNIGSKANFEQKELAYLAAQNKFNVLSRQLLRKQDELKILFQKSEINYANRLNLQAEFIVRSRINGNVYELMKEEGESVNEQEPIALIGSMNQFIIKMQVDEVDIVRISKGQSIFVTLDAYENQVFQAVVSQIIPQIDQKTQTFWVEGTFNKPPVVLYSGLRGEANILISQKDRALTIPLAYLIDRDKVLTADESLTVATGLRSLERVEILSGLDSTTIIFKHE